MTNPVRHPIAPLPADLDLPDAPEEETPEETPAAPAGTPLSQLATTTEEDGGEDAAALETLQARVVLDDGREWSLPVRNEDFVAFDMSRRKMDLPAAEDAPFVLNNFLAWHASKRAGHFSGGFRAFVSAVAHLTVAKGTPARPTR